MSVKMKVIRTLLKTKKENDLKKLKYKQITSVYDVLTINSNRNTIDAVKKFALRNFIKKYVTIANVPCLHLTPNYKTKHFINSPKNQNIIFLYVHGGGFVSGFCEQGALFVKALERRIGCQSYLVNYSLSPEHTFPYALNQIYDVYLELIKTHKPKKIIIGGESAGGNLCLSLLLKLKQQNKPLPKLAIIASGYLDLSNSGISYTKNQNSDVSLSNTQTPYMAKAYVCGNKSETPSVKLLKSSLISPMFGNFKGLCPIFFSVCSDELLYSDTLTTYQKCKQQKVKAKLFESSNCFHAYLALGDFFEESKLASNEMAKFVKSVMRLKQINLID